MARSSVKNARKPRARSLSPSGRESGNSSDHERHFFTKHSSPTQKNNKYVNLTFSYIPPSLSNYFLDSSVAHGLIAAGAICRNLT